MSERERVEAGSFWESKTNHTSLDFTTNRTLNVDHFVPTVIRQQRKKEDYVLFKLDIDSKEVETAIVDHLLRDDNDDLSYIDEFVWEVSESCEGQGLSAIAPKFQSNPARFHSFRPVCAAPR